MQISNYDLIENTIMIPNLTAANFTPAILKTLFPILGLLFYFLLSSFSSLTGLYCRIFISWFQGERNRHELIIGLDTLFTKIQTHGKDP